MLRILIRNLEAVKSRERVINWDSKSKRSNLINYSRPSISIKINLRVESIIKSNSTVKSCKLKCFRRKF